MTDYVLDTVALVRHLEDTLPAAAGRAVGEAEAGKGRLWLPEIALGEFAYIALRGRLRVPDPRATLDEVLDQVRAASYIRIACLDSAAWDVFVHLTIPELHDRMVAAESLHRAVPVISSDPAFDEVPDLARIWE